MKKLTTLLCLLLVLGLLLPGCGNDPSDNAAAQQDPQAADTPDNQETQQDPQTSDEPTSEEDLADNRRTAPDFTVYDVDGNAVHLSDFLGKPVVLNFWASWCGPCKAEMPDFQHVYETLGDQVQFLMINLTDGQEETVESASGFIAEQGYTFPVYYDTASEAVQLYDVQSIPTTCFIDAEGNVATGYTGMMSADILMHGIDLILPAE